MKILAALICFVIVTSNCTVAQADIGGQIPGPGLCDYPAVCDVGAEMGAYHYRSAMPVEENGSQHVCTYGGAMVQGVASLNLVIVQAGLSAPIGALEGGCHWLCPDGSPAAAPRPPGAWRNAIVPTACVPLGPPPAPTGDELSDQAPPAEPFPTVTNPVAPNPEATLPAGQ